MGLRNVQALSVLAPLNKTGQRLGVLLEQIAKQDRLVRPGIDPAALVISERIRSQVASLETVDRGIQLGRNVLNIADASLSGISDQLNNVRSLTLQAANTAFSDDSTQAVIQGAIDQEIRSINNQISTTRFAGTPLFANAAFRTTDDTAGALTNVQFTQTPTPVGDGIDVDVTVNAVATQATTTLTVGGQTQFTLEGSLGATTISGATAADFAAQINASTDDTGVTALDLGGGQVQLSSDDPGADEFVSVTNISGSGFAPGEAGTFYGTNADVTVNGAPAQANGNVITFDANGVIGGFTVDAATAAGTQTQVSIVGGGLTIPVDEAGSTITIGIPPFAGNLGASSGDGNLNYLMSGGSADIRSGVLGDQLSIVDAALDEVNSGRAQIGATDSNLASASNAVQSHMSGLMASLSDIRDVDFAASVADLARTQLQREVQISLLRRSNINQANVSRLLLGGN